MLESAIHVGEIYSMISGKFYHIAPEGSDPAVRVKMYTPNFQTYPRW
jgi:hypothetical protein